MKLTKINKLIDKLIPKKMITNKILNKKGMK